mgnify:CR=1 FL=1
MAMMDYLLNEDGRRLRRKRKLFFEFVLTNKDNINNFGEARPGGVRPTIPLPEVLKLQRDYPYVKKLIPGTGRAGVSVRRGNGGREDTDGPAQLGRSVCAGMILQSLTTR